MGIDEAKKDVRQGNLDLAKFEINGIVAEIKSIERKLGKWLNDDTKRKH